MIDSICAFVLTAHRTGFGPYEMLYEGSLNGSKVCVKKLDPSLTLDWEHVIMVLRKPCVFPTRPADWIDSGNFKTLSSGNI